MRARKALLASVLSAVCTVVLSIALRGGAEGRLHAEAETNAVYAFCTKNAQIEALCVIIGVLEVTTGAVVTCRLAGCKNARVIKAEEPAQDVPVEQTEEAEKIMEGFTEKVGSADDVFEDQMLFLAKDDAAPPVDSFWERAASNNGVLENPSLTTSYNDAFGDMDIQSFDSAAMVDELERGVASETKTVWYEVASTDDCLFNFANFQDSTFGALSPEKAQSMVYDHDTEFIEFSSGLEDAQSKAGFTRPKSEVAAEDDIGNSFFPNDDQFFPDGHSIGPQEYRPHPARGGFEDPDPDSEGGLDGNSGPDIIPDL